MTRKQMMGALAVGGLVAWGLFLRWTWIVPSDETKRMHERIVLEEAQKRQQEDEERIARGEPTTQRDPLLDVGPNPGASREQREHMVLDLLTGNAATTALPVVATEEGERFDIRLRDQIAPAPQVVVRPGGPIRPPGLKCNCAPDDPLCSCL